MQYGTYLVHCVFLVLVLLPQRLQLPLVQLLQRLCVGVLPAAALVVVAVAASSPPPCTDAAAAAAGI